MNTQDIKELFALQGVLADVGIASATPEVLAALLNWKGNGVAKPSASQPKPPDPVAAKTPTTKAKTKASTPPPEDDDPGF